MLRACGGGGTITHITNLISWHQQSNSALLSPSMPIKLIMPRIFFVPCRVSSINLPLAARRPGKVRGDKRCQYSNAVHHTYLCHAPEHHYAPWKQSLTSSQSRVMKVQTAEHWFLRRQQQFEADAFKLIQDVKEYYEVLKEEKGGNHAHPLVSQAW